MRRLVLLLAVVLAAVSLYADTGSAMKSMEKPFVSGGRIDIDLESGNYTIKPSDQNKIVVRWDDRESVQVTLDTTGNNARVRTVHTPHNSFSAEIEVPRTSDLHIRLTAGNLDVRAVRGNKDIESNAGNVDITIGDPQDYGRVDASLWAGNIDATPFEKHKNGLFRSLDWHGKGQYRLHAHLLAGNLTLKGGTAD